MLTSLLTTPRHQNLPLTTLFPQRAEAEREPTISTLRKQALRQSRYYVRGEDHGGISLPCAKAALIIVGWYEWIWLIFSGGCSRNSSYLLPSSAIQSWESGT